MKQLPLLTLGANARAGPGLSSYVQDPLGLPTSDHITASLLPRYSLIFSSQRLSMKRALPTPGSECGRIAAPLCLAGAAQHLPGFQSL